MCLTNLMANNFVLKGGEFYRTQLVTSDLLARFILWSPLLLPLWIRIAADALCVRIPLKLLTAFAILSVVVSFPFSAIDLSAPLPWLDFLRSALRDGIVQPSALLLTVAGIAGFVRAAPPSRARVIAAVLVSASGAALLKLLISGPALPRLEDETGYHLQSLIFQSGALKASILALPDAPLVMDALRLPFTGQDGLSYYSLHLHGWPLVLALFGALSLSPFANLLFSILNVFLFYRLLSLHMAPGKWPAIVSLAVFSLSPLLLFLSGTYMAHTFALTLSLLLVHCHERITLQNSARRNVFFAFSCFLTAGVLVLVRPQTLAPLAAALLAAGFLDRGKDTRSAVLRALTLVGGAACGYLALRTYGMSFPGFPVNSDPCNAPGFGPGHGCFPTYGTLGHTLQKTLFNTGDLISRWNQELSPGGLPVLFVTAWLFLRRWRSAMRSRLVVLYALTVAASIAQFGLFFHNGGESYHGRYLTESSFAMAMLLGLLLQLESAAREDGGESLFQLAGRMIVPASILLAAGSALLQIRGEYFHPHIEPFRTASALAPVRDSLIVLELPENADLPSRDEFTGDTISIPRSRVKTYLNLGYGTLAATAVRIGKEGIPEDRFGNLLLGEMKRSDALKLAQTLKRPAYVLKFGSFEPVTKSSRYMRFWRRERPALRRLEQE